MEKGLCTVAIEDSDTYPRQKKPSNNKEKALFCTWWYCSVVRWYWQHNIMLELGLKVWILLGKLVLLTPAGISVLLGINCTVDCGLIWWFIWLQHLSYPSWCVCRVFTLCGLFIPQALTDLRNLPLKLIMRQLETKKWGISAKTIKLNGEISTAVPCMLQKEAGKEWARVNWHCNGVGKENKRAMEILMSLYTSLLYPDLKWKDSLSFRGYLKDFHAQFFTCVNRKLAPSSLMRFWNIPG